MEVPHALVKLRCASSIYIIVVNQRKCYADHIRAQIRLQASVKIFILIGEIAF